MQTVPKAQPPSGSRETSQIALLEQAASALPDSHSTALATYSAPPSFEVSGPRAVVSPSPTLSDPTQWAGTPILVNSAVFNPPPAPAPPNRPKAIKNSLIAAVALLGLLTSTGGLGTFAQHSLDNRNADIRAVAPRLVDVVTMLDQADRRLVTSMNTGAADRDARASVSALTARLKREAAQVDSRTTGHLAQQATAMVSIQLAYVDRVTPTAPDLPQAAAAIRALDRAEARFAGLVRAALRQSLPGYVLAQSVHQQ